MELLLLIYCGYFTILLGDLHSNMELLLQFLIMNMLKYRIYLHSNMELLLQIVRSIKKED